MPLRLRPRRPRPLTVGFIQPCQPIGAAKPPSGAGRLHEIKLDGFRLMAQRRGVGGRLLTRNGNDWTERYPSVATSDDAKAIRGHLDKEVTWERVETTLGDLHGSLHPVMSHAWSKVENGQRRQVGRPAAGIG
jgi:bifunctional non-homologous end joining protein LigD